MRKSIKFAAIGIVAVVGLVGGAALLLTQGHAMMHHHMMAMMDGMMTGCAEMHSGSHGAGQPNQQWRQETPS